MDNLIRGGILLKSVLLIFCILNLLSDVVAQEQPTFNIAVSTSTSTVRFAYQNFIKEVYNEIGITVVFESFPIKRAARSAELGLIDAILVQSSTVTENSKDLVVVPVVLSQVALVACTIDKVIEVNGMQSLAPYTIGFLRGYTLTEKLTAGYERFLVGSFESLFSMLQLGRIDVAIVLRSEAHRFIEENPKFNNVKILDTPLLTLPLFHIVNKKHEVLLPKLTSIMQKKIKEKRFENLYIPYVVDKPLEIPL